MMGLRDALLKAGYKPYSYSGRFMYGRRCVAVDMKSLAGLFELGLHVAQAAGEQADLSDAGQLRVDDMGLGIVVYWPNAEWDPSWDAEQAPEPWRCPECRHLNEAEVTECFECGYAPEEDEG